MSELNNEFTARMRSLLGESDFNAYLAALEQPPLKYARINPLKRVDEKFIAAELGGFPVLPSSAKPGLCSLHAAGAYYVQEPAAAAVADMLPPLLDSGDIVLDMCAAPGGKVTAAACARPDCTFFANEIVFNRAKILLGNIERMGLRNCTVGSLKPEDISKLCGASFNAVIADVPCSGEGMVRKTDFGSADLSDRTVEACAARARKILDECNACLAEGGILAFSTCTFNLQENEQAVRYLIDKYGYVPISPAEFPERARHGFDLPQAVRFFPQDGGGEGHFACLLRKPDCGERAKFKPNKIKNRGKAAAVIAELKKISNEILDINNIMQIGDGYELLKPNYPFANLPALRRGMKLADIVGDRIVIHHHYATAANFNELISPVNLHIDSPQLQTYLRGGEFDCRIKNGFNVVCVEGVPLGLIKEVNGIAKNHYPKGLRIN